MTSMTDPMTDESRRIFFQAPELLPTPLPSASASPSVAGPARTETSEARKLGTLVHVSQALAGSVDLTAGLSGVLAILARRCAVVRGAVALLDEHARELHIRAAVGLSREGQAVRYRIGEGVTGAVAESGEPIVVPEMGEFSFVCVPIVLHRRVGRHPLGRADLTSRTGSTSGCSSSSGWWRR